MSIRGWLRRWLGDRGERAAAQFLRRKGLRVLARQHRTPEGEIDLIALDGNCVVFVEVKTRSTSRAGRPDEAITPTKQAQMTRVAVAFLKRRRLLHRSARFDVVAITWPENGAAPEITHYINAFDAVGAIG